MQFRELKQVKAPPTRPGQRHIGINLAFEQVDNSVLPISKGNYDGIETHVQDQVADGAVSWMVLMEHIPESHKRTNNLGFYRIAILLVTWIGQNSDSSVLSIPADKSITGHPKT